MAAMIQVREYALLTHDTNQQASIDLGVVSKATFDWLLDLHARWKNNSTLLKLQSSTTVKLESYVGFLQSPSGETIEILPKTHLKQPNQQELSKCRAQLRGMLLTALSLKPREADAALLQRSNTPLHEWIISEFLFELVKLVRHGLYFEYLQIEEESRFIRGQLDIAKQSRQTPDKATLFHIRHDIFSANRRENRLLKTALEYVLNVSVTSDNWRIANELNHKLCELASYTNPIAELPRWQSGKIMAQYNDIRPWCELIIEKLNPNFQKGIHEGIALLFPMEYLFESYVAFNLRKSLSSGCSLKTQARSCYLMSHQPNSSLSSTAWFQLKPDLLLVAPLRTHVMDTKWKLLNGKLSTTEDKYGLKQSDMYQLFAYGQKYMEGKGHMMLIYPVNENFDSPLPCFSFDSKLHLWVVPFDLDTRRLVNGDWGRHFPDLVTNASVINAA